MKSALHKYPLIIFLAISVAIHALFYGWLMTLPHSVSSGDEVSELEIVLHPTVAVTSASTGKVSARPPKAVNHEPVKLPDVIRANQADQIVAAQPLSVVSPAPAVQSLANVTKVAVAEQAIEPAAPTPTPDELLAEELAKYFYYPKLAQRNGWQGQMVLEFLTTSTGELKNIHATRTTGYSMLDDAAVAALKKIDPQIITRIFDGDAAVHAIPVRFQLTSP